MRETREQFRERMHEVGYDGAMIAWRDFQASEYAGAAEAGYAAALRDIMAEMLEREVVVGAFAITIPTVTDDDLMIFADERGIDLEAKP